MGHSFMPLVLLLNLLFLCQLGSAFQSRSLARAVTGTNPTYSAGFPKSGSSYYRDLPYSTDCHTDDGLPCPEVNALRELISSLGLSRPPSINRHSCDGSTLSSINITCSCNNGTVCHITDIIMENAGLSGVIHKYVTNLTYLQTLDLSKNDISGSIPDEIGKLTNLISLDLSGNQLNGAIPNSLGNLTKLESLALKLNFLSGPIPPSLGNLSSLVYLNLRSNNLTGEIPPELGNLTELEELRLDENELSGKLPSELGKLKNLEELWVTSNGLNGEIPKEYENLANLFSFEVGGNYLSGPIPPFIAKWTNLTSLDLMGNDFDGALPPEIFNMSSLEFLWVSDLKEPGLVFPDRANLTNVIEVILRKCAINGRIPEYIGSWTTLRILDLSHNSLNGEIPATFQNLTLVKMFLTGNKLSGNIPSWISKVVYYKGDLSYNDFTFPKPGKDRMQLSHNNSKNVTFPDPTKINVEPKNKTDIYQIMDERCHDKKYKFHSLFINAGGEKTKIETRPYDADQNTSLFYVSPNNWAYSCSGDFLSSSSNASDYIKTMTCGVPSIDAPLYEKARLCPQDLTYYGFCLRNGKYFVNLHFAESVYAKDEDYSSLGKRVFDIYIQDKLERQNFNIKEKAKGPNNKWIEKLNASVQDNLLEIRLSWAGKGSIYNTPALNGPLISAISVTPDFPVGGLSFAEIVVIAVSAIFVPLLLLVFMWIMGWVGQKKLRETSVELRGKPYTVKQVVDATKNFSSKMEIGRGQFGIVYKADLPDQVVAVKKLMSPHSKQVIDQIGREVYTLKTLKHENLVEFLDGYSRNGLHLLIFEYMEHRSLAFALFDPKSNTVLNWDARFNICMGIAKALKYLHEDSRKIVHGNIKPSNILLDRDLKAKVSDFGLAKLYEEEKQNVVIGAGDTLIYMAPEYTTMKVITEKADVYSYGIVLLEIVSGKKNAEYKTSQETVYVIDMAHSHKSKGTLTRLIDAKLSTYKREQALDILNLALLCIHSSPSRRPTISEVVSVLEGNKTIEEISKADTLST